MHAKRTSRPIHIYLKHLMNAGQRTATTNAEAIADIVHLRATRYARRLNGSHTAVIRDATHLLLILGQVFFIV